MIIQLKEWETPSGMWHAAFTDKFTPHVNNAVLIARMLKKPYNEYVSWVIEKYSPDWIKYSKKHGTVFFGWRSQTAMRKFKNEINAMLRQAGDFQF